MSHELRQRIIEESGRLGFDACRFSDVHAQTLPRMREWLHRGYHGDMVYLENHLPYREDPSRLLTGVRSAVILIKNYKNTVRQRLHGPYKVARYAVGQDYHEVIMSKLEKLESMIRKTAPDVRCYLAIDSRPVDERELAVRAGIGFRGRNTMVIRPGLGSYFFIAVVLTTAELSPDTPMQAGCGTCRACIDACPTQAILEEGSLDATRCISYWTIEKKTAMNEKESAHAESWIFGCDICQEVCPFNHTDIDLTDWTEFMPEGGVGFDFFDHRTGLDVSDIPKTTALHRSRKRVVANWHAKRDHGKKR